MDADSWVIVLKQVFQADLAREGDCIGHFPLPYVVGGKNRQTSILYLYQKSSKHCRVLKNVNNLWNRKEGRFRNPLYQLTIGYSSVFIRFGDNRRKKCLRSTPSHCLQKSLCPFRQSGGRSRPLVEATAQLWSCFTSTPSHTRQVISVLTAHHPSVGHL